ncbi:toll/interleukin-1 receptor domain-containing protein [Methylorubrum extorquens]|uniref:TIR protein n=1 Tax=Methylorubrum extorquens (strain CM4 / NCIMB 13688) TaxID=440085 RepID=B7L2V6_METC4|nr:toll/interleukin-1 receptor domain-containing protein [Methylorubrum extorquens]ACK86164.1 TIR protein [Methylorubrum extorquens CM4]
MAVRRATSDVLARGSRKGARSDEAPAVAAPIRVFISYSHMDDAARRRLDIHMAQLKREGVSVFFDGDMIAGAELDPRIRRELRLADIFVALASPAYLHSRYCFEIEYGYALRKAKRGKVHLVVALIEECQWRHTRMARYKLLPKDGKPVSKWRPHGEAFEDIVNGLRGVVKAVRADRATSSLDKRVRTARAAQPAKRPSAPEPPSRKRKTVPVGPSKAAASPSRPAKSRTPARKPAGRPRQGGPGTRSA